jgi:hypothetical protein
MHSDEIHKELDYGFIYAPYVPLTFSHNNFIDSNGKEFIFHKAFINPGHKNLPLTLWMNYKIDGLTQYNKRI